MIFKRLFKKKLTASTDKKIPKPDSTDSKDILAFVIALYQLFAPLLIALLVVGVVVALIVSYLF